MSTVYSGSHLAAGTMYGNVRSPMNALSYPNAISTEMRPPMTGGPQAQGGVDAMAEMMAINRHKQLQQNLMKLLTDPVYESLFDCVLIAEGREIRAHKCILAANCEYFRTAMCSGSHAMSRIDFSNQRYTVVKQLVNYIYGGELDENTSLTDIMDVLGEARALGVETMDSTSVAQMVVARLTMETSLGLLEHAEIVHHPLIAKGVCQYAGEHLLEILKNHTAKQRLVNLREDNKPFVIELIKVAAAKCRNERDVELVVVFAVEWSQNENACDLLKDCKNWPWNADQGKLSIFRTDASETGHEISSYEWRISNIKDLLSGTRESPQRFVCGMCFDWSVRIDHGAENKVRIVYENATERDPTAGICLKRFPAAMFAWQVIFRGQNVFYERPVFICFPQDVNLHWSTTLPIVANEIHDDDEIIITCTMAENPLISLILYHFSNDLEGTVAAEDILNRLPHIEYRCLSAYGLTVNMKKNKGGPL
ncbi:unnamed protein product [Vitrella brassicaformis CCMP3155]|uniref:BTB domain-containing protein n=1 Tax=Vitrella brassicaformis (strain CCMP3155) TaxID=1169540 RepID=A0A0G4FZI2_VITBC|nr:unnamed protein product [Vitrella brassicaformis CCMP3155]|eukprot:CEM20933.1 unnamed protein product [Vitrella brassicaformis CCMP3155]